LAAVERKKIARPLKPQSALLISRAFIGKMQTYFRQRVP